MFQLLNLSGSVILGWALGANHNANVFGTAVASRMIRYRTAVLLGAGCVLIGAVAGGGKGIDTLGRLMPNLTTHSALVITLATAIAVVGATFLKLPVSTSQGIIGAIVGYALHLPAGQVDWTLLAKHLTEIVICWIGTPLGAAVIAAILYPTLGWLMDRLPANIVTRSILLKFGLLIAGSYGAFALGANNVANTTGVFYGPMKELGIGHVEMFLAAVGGVGMALGVLTSSRKVMFTVGSELVSLGAFSALVAVLAEAITVHFFSFVGVPVSTSQAIIGAVLGIGISKSARTIDRGTLFKILFGWVASPVIAGAISFALMSLVVK